MIHFIVHTQTDDDDDNNETKLTISKFGKLKMVLIAPYTYLLTHTHKLCVQ